jgi:hypothetical protein
VVAGGICLGYLHSLLLGEGFWGHPSGDISFYEFSLGVESGGGFLLLYVTNGLKAFESESIQTSESKFRP